MSRKFRMGFKDTFGPLAPCCVAHRSPEFGAYSVVHEATVVAPNETHSITNMNSLKLQRFGSFYNNNGSVKRASSSYNQLSSQPNFSPTQATTTTIFPCDQLNVNSKNMSLSCSNSLLTPTNDRIDVNQEEKLLLITSSELMPKSAQKEIKNNCDNRNNSDNRNNTDNRNGNENLMVML